MFLCLFLVPQMRGIPAGLPLGIPLIADTLEKVRFPSPPATSSLLTSPSTYLHRGKGLREQASQAHLQGPAGTEFGRGKEKEIRVPFIAQTSWRPGR